MTVLTIKIKHENQEIPLSWTESCWPDLTRFYLLQTGKWNWSNDNPSVAEFISVAKPRITGDFNRLARSIGTIDGIDGGMKIIDVGSGIGIHDLLLYQKISNQGMSAKMFLVDKDAYINVRKGILFYEPEIGYNFYNSWAPVENAILAIGLPRSDFMLMSPEDPWPIDSDLIFSTYSWCWHYPPEIYLDKLLASLKIGGKLILDVIHRLDRNFVEEISEVLGSVPITTDIQAPKSADHFLNGKQIVRNGTIGQQCQWIRKR
jgi:SAM-dependent methyltransferase